MVLMFTNYYSQLGNPFFEADGHVWDRDLMPPDASGYLPDDLIVLPEPTWNSFPDNQPLSADEARTLLWLFAGDVSKAARYYKMPPQRLRAFVSIPPNCCRAWRGARAHPRSGRGRPVRGLFSDDPKQARFSQPATFSRNRRVAARDFTR